MVQYYHLALTAVFIDTNSDEENNQKEDPIIDIESDEENNREEDPVIVNRTENFDDIFVGKVVLNEKEAYDLYNNYATTFGFSVLQTDGTLKVAQFFSQHNHELAKPEERLFFRSNRKVSEAQLGVIKTMAAAGIRTTNTYSYLAEEAGGSQNVGFTQRDCYNVVNKEKMVMFEARDAQSLINLFKHKQAEDHMFFYTVQVDQENRMTNFFLRDGRSRLDYECSGDVVVFDTTYRTNRYNMICAPFVGVNHHWKNCQAMANGIEKVFSGSTWDELVAEVNLTGCSRMCSRMNMLYALRAKWCPAFSHDTFTCRIQSSQRSESTNNVFHQISTKTMRLIEFVHHYDKQAAKMRTSESEESYRCNQGLPSRVAQRSGILKHAATVYTRKMFKIFEKEFLNSLAVTMHEYESCGTIHSFELNEEGHTRVYLVQLNSSDGTVSCSCKMYESMGLLCRHALRGEVNKESNDNNDDDCNANGCSVDEPPILNPPLVRPKGVSNARLKSAMEKRKKKASKDTVSSGKTKKPSNIGHSHSSTPYDSNFLQQLSVPTSTNVTQVFPAVSLLTTNNHALPPYNQVIQPSFSFTTMLQDSQFMASQNSSSSFIAHEPFGLNPQLSQVEDDMFWVGNL
ncbi:hypothetical protein PS2_000527 [Malus domestica]